MKVVAYHYDLEAEAFQQKQHQETNLNFNHMYGVPATLDFVIVSSLFDEDHTSKSMLKIPQVYWTYTTLKVPTKETIHTSWT